MESYEQCFGRVLCICSTGIQVEFKEVCRASRKVDVCDIVGYMISECSFTMNAIVKQILRIKYLGTFSQSICSERMFVSRSY